MTARQELEHAYRLIQHDQIYEAQEVLRPILMVDPDNVHAWWLLAYASTDLDEVRRALTAVLALDPDYANAPKAREMLEQLNMLYPPEEADQAVPAGLFTLEGEGLEDVLEGESADDLFAEPEEPDLVIVEQDVFVEQEPAFAPLDESVGEEVLEVGLAEPNGDENELEEMFADLEDGEEILEISEYEDLAPAETAANRRAGWLAAGLVVLLGVAVLLGVLLLREDKEPVESEEPGALTMLMVDSDNVVMAIAAAEADLDASPVGENGRAFVARSSLGDTFYVEFCGQPRPALASEIMRAMAVGARQAPALNGDVAAIGVSAMLCRDSGVESIYRAVTPVQEASEFAIARDESEVSQAQFQQQWQSP